ncbi:non-reducing end alpha-L-arabinofuranosidase family hydrolase [Streptomyces lycii]
MRPTRRTGAVLGGLALLLGASVSGPATAPAGASETTDRTPPAASAADLPSSFQWSSTGPVIAPKSDASHDIAGIKDPSVVFHDGKWHVYASTTSTAGNYSLAYTSFEDWSRASAAPQYFLDQNPNIGTGYRAAPQVFYFAPQDKWYLVYQTGNGSFSTTDDPGKPETWSAPQNFYSGMPDIIRDNIGDGYWVDFWVICDDVKCYLFSSDDNGHLYRSETTVEDFPNGFTNTVIAMEDSDRYRLFEAVNIYRIKGSDSYLMLHEAIGTDGRRYFRSWTSDAITGPWTALADTESNPFARANNVTFEGSPWTNDISHGELLRDGTDQTLTIDPCDLRYLYQGMDPNAGGEYNKLPWRLGLLTQTNSAC